MIPVLIAPKIERTSGTTTFPFVVSTPVDVGQVVAVMVGGVFPTGVTPECEDSRGNTYTLRTQTNSNTTATAIFTAVVTTALEVGDTITVTQSNTVANGFGAAYSLDEGATYIDAVSGVNNNAGPTSSGTVAVDDDPHTFLDLVMTSRGSSTANVVTHASPWVEDQTGQSGSSTRKWYGTSSRTSSAAGSYGHTSTLPVSGAWSDSIVAFKDPSDEPPEPTAGTQISAWPGDQTDTSFKVVAHTDGTTELRLQVSTDSGMASPTVYAPVAPDVNGYSVHVATGLAPNTRYYYQLTDTPSGGTATALRAPRRAPTTSQTAGVPFGTRTILFGGCVRTNSVNHLALIAADAEEADYGIGNGDVTYGGPNSTDQALHRAAFENQLANVAPLLELIENGGMAEYLASDHDTSNIDNADSNDAVGAAALANRKHVTPMGPGQAASTYKVKPDGNLSTFHTDTRNTQRSTGSTADGPGKTLLGATQLAAVLDWLANDPAPVKFMTLDTPWAGASDWVNKTDWWPAYPTERAIVQAAIADSLAAGTTKLFFMGHGDAHGLGVMEPEDNDWGGFFLFCAAGYDQDGGGRNTSLWTSYWNNASGDVQQYGLLTLVDDGTDFTVQFDGKDAVAGLTRVTSTQTISLAEPVQAQLAATLPALAAAATATTPITAALTGTLPPLAATAAAATPAGAALTATLPALTATAQAAVPVRGTLAATLPALTGAATAATPVTAALAATLPALQATATVTGPVVAALTATLPPLTASLQADVVSGVPATLTATLPALQAAATAATPVTGQVAATLPPLTAAAVATAPIAAVVAVTLPALTAALAADTDEDVVEVVLTAVLPALVAAAAAATPVSAVLAAVLPALAALAAPPGSAPPVSRPGLLLDDTTTRLELDPTTVAIAWR